MTSASAISRLSDMLRAHGVTRAYYKWLALNDNSKHGIYLGSDYSAINLLPVGQVTSRATGKGGRPVLKAPVALDWLTADSGVAPAPHAQIILYPQYPEVRLTGFLRGCPESPSTVVTDCAGSRLLFLGVTAQGRLVAYAVGASSLITRELPARDPQDRGVLHEFPLGGTFIEDESELHLLAELRRIHRLGWIESKRLNQRGEVLPCNAQQCGGYTLEAELGVRPNGISEPDFEGWEVKSHTVPSFDRPAGVITLVTPEPDGGFYKMAGAERFIRRFGYPDVRGRPDRLNFGGIYRVGIRVGRTGLTLCINGFDPAKERIVDLAGGIQLMTDASEVAAQWSFPKLIQQWARKHAKAAYVPNELQREPRRQYRYGRFVNLGRGSDFARFLGALHSGSIYYDPALKIEQVSTEAAQTKRRSQFRIKGSGLPVLYRSFDVVDAG